MQIIFCDVQTDEEVTIEMEIKEVLQLLNALKSCIAISLARGKLKIKIMDALALSSIVTDDDLE